MSRGAIGLLAAAMIVATMGSVLADGTVVTGNVVYRERMLLPAGAEAAVRLEDVSLADAPARVLAETSVPASTSPTPFVLAYPASEIVPGRRYALRASISVGDELLFASTEHHAFDPAQTDGIELLVQRVAGDPAAALPLAGNWLAEDIGGRGVIDDLQTVLTIAEDGSVTGHGGCNGFGGRAMIEGSKLSFGPMAGTLMACPEAVMAQENAFHDALSRTAGFRIDAAEHKLYLLDASGAELARLVSN